MTEELKPAPDAQSQGAPNGAPDLTKDEPRKAAPNDDGESRLSDSSDNSERAGSAETDVADNSDVKVIVPPVNQAYLPEALEEAAQVVEETDGKPELKEQEFTIVAHTDSERQKDPHGVYLDDVQRAQAETIRARVEGREPDYANPGTTASDVVVPSHVARQNVDGNAHVPVAFKQEVMVGAKREGDEEE